MSRRRGSAGRSGRVGASCSPRRLHERTLARRDRRRPRRALGVTVRPAASRRRLVAAPDDRDGRDHRRGRRAHGRFGLPCPAPPQPLSVRPLCSSPWPCSSPATRRAGASCPDRRRSPASGSSPRRAATTPMATSPPAGPDPGLLLLIVAGIGLVALVVDTLAAGLDLPGMTLIPLACPLRRALGDRTAAQPRGGPSSSSPSGGWRSCRALQRDRASGWSPGARAGSPGVGLAIAGNHAPRWHWSPAG